MSRTSQADRWWAADLVALLVATPLALAALVVINPNSTAVRTLLTLPLALFAPGYAIVALLYPERYEFESTVRSGLSQSSEETLEGVTPTAGLSPLTRVLVAVGLSIVVVPVIAIVLDFVVGIYWLPTFGVVTALTVLLSLGALIVRARYPADRRFSIGPLFAAVFQHETADRRLGGSQSSSLLGSVGTPGGALLTVGVLVFVGSLLFAALLPVAGIPSPGQSHFTEFYLTTQNESGDYVLSDYPTEFGPGESQTVFITIGNSEGESVEYTVVAKLQRAEVTDGETRVTGEQELRRVSRSVEAGERARIEHSIQPSQEGRLRLAYMLYKGEPPATPTTENAYRSTHLWITVGGQGDRTAPVTTVDTSEDEPSRPAEGGN